MAQTGLVRADFQQLLSKMQSREARMRDAHTPPRDDDDLAEWIWAYCGLKVPTVAVCPGHVAPLEPLADAFFERQMDQVWLANRGGAKTRGLSLLHHLNLMFKPGYEIASVGAIREQAARCYEYLRGYTELEWFHIDRQYSSMKKTVYKKGGSAEILSGTMGGVNCLAGETIIDTLDGKHRIKDLVGKSGFYVHAWDSERQCVVPDKVLRVWKKGRNLVYKVTFDQSVLFATSEHPVRLIDGTWQPVGELRPRDRVLALKRRSIDGGAGMYWHLCLGKNWLPEHRWIARELIGKIDGLDVHHIDGDTLNNQPYNLSILDRKEHMRLHAQTYWTQERRQAWGKRMSMQVAEQWQTSERHHAQAKGWRNQCSSANDDRPWTELGVMQLLVNEGITFPEIGRRLGCDGATARAWAERLGLHVRIAKPVGCWQDEEWLRCQFVELGLSATKIAQGLPVSRQAIDYWVTKFGLEVEKWPWRNLETVRHLFEDEGLNGSQIARRLGCPQQIANAWLHRHGLRNHVVMRVEPCAVQDVYDMNTEKHHNFFAEDVNVSNSPHPILLAIDEVELLPWTILQQAFSMPISGGGFKAMTILTSTRKFRTGTMQRLLDKIEDDPSFPYRLYSWCIWEICAKCTMDSCDHCQRAVLRDRDGELQSFWDVCGGKAKKSDGFMLLDDIWRKFCTMDWDVFDAEWLGVRPGRVGQVFKGFSEDVHARRFPIDLGLFKQTAIVMDDGWTSPLAVLFLGRDSRDNLFCFDSLYGAEWAHDAVAEALREKYDLYGWSVPGRDESGNDVKLYNQKPLYVDQRAPRTIHKFRTEFGFDARAIGAPIDEGNRWIRRLLTNRRRKTGALELLIHPDTCKELIDEFVTLHWPTDRDGSVTSDKYRGDDHLIDTLRYGGAVFGLLEGEDIVVQTSIDVSRPTARVPTNATWKRSVELRVQQQRSRWRGTRLPARYRR